MVVPERAERIRDVQVAIRVDQVAASGPEDHLWRRRERFRTFECNLRRDEGTSRRQRLPAARYVRMAAQRHHLLDPGPRHEARQCQSHPNILTIADHHYTTCGVLK